MLSVIHQLPHPPFLLLPEPLPLVRKGRLVGGGGTHQPPSPSGLLSLLRWRAQRVATMLRTAHVSVRFSPQTILSPVSGLARLKSSRHRRTYTTSAPVETARPVHPEPKMKPFPLSEEEEHIWTAVDEAGSNAVLGPIVLAAITASKPQLEVLWNRGLSLPHLGPTQRDRLAIEIRKTVSYARVLMVEAEEINDLMEENRLSVEEILSLKTAQIFKEWPKPMGTLLLDAFNQKPQEWMIPFQKLLANAPGLNNVVCNSSLRADSKNVATKAAWVLARVERDRRLHQLASLYKHDTGTGYLSDFKTREYLRIFIPKLSRHAHPVNMIRYHGWSRKMIAGWREIEEYRWKRQKEEYYQQYPSMLKGDPLRGTGIFEPKDGPRKSWSQHPLAERAVGVAEFDQGVPPKSTK